MLSLHVDTSKIEETYIFLEKDGQKFEKRSVSKEKRSQMLLPLIEELLTEQHFDLKDITEITVNTGPGSFTGLKVGATVAGTLSLLLNIPINGSSAGKIPEINYGEDKWGIKRLEVSD